MQCILPMLHKIKQFELRTQNIYMTGHLKHVRSMSNNREVYTNLRVKGIEQCQDHNKYVFGTCWCVCEPKVISVSVSVSIKVSVHLSSYMVKLSELGGHVIRSEIYCSQLAA